MNLLQREKERMDERAFLKLNGYLFMVKPVTLGEEAMFYDVCNFSIVPFVEDGEEIKDENKVALLEALCERKNFPPKITKRKIFGFSFGDNYTADYYYEEVMMFGLIKWIEQKVTLNGKNIRFYDLENKYGLTKLEIYAIIEKFYDLSNFPQHLSKTKK